MKIKLFVISLIIWLAFFAGLTKKRTFKFVPYGTTRLTDSLYIDKQPIKVRDYLEFLSDIRRSYTPRFHDSIQNMPLFDLSPKIAFHLYDSLPMDSVFYEKMLTRTMQVLGNDRRIYGVDYRLLSSKYYNYPIVNVNYYQIFEYCRWRTDKVRLHYTVKSKNLRQRKKYPINFKFRIVKRLEWEKALGMFFNEIGKLDRKVNDISIIENQSAPYILERKRKFYYDSYNVAEYLDGELITTGFNWVKGYGIGDVNYMFFEKPTDWIGFRCICEIQPDTIFPAAKVEVIKPKKPKKKKKVKKSKKKKIKGIENKDLKRKKQW